MWLEIASEPGPGVAIRNAMFVTAFFLCFIVMFCSFIPGLGDGNIRRRKSKRDVCDLQRTSLPLQVTVLVLGEQIRR